MKFKILSEKPVSKLTALVGKNGVIRINNLVAQMHKLSREDRWLVAVAENDKSNKSIYLIKNNSSEGFKGNKMMYLNNSWSLKCENILREFKINPPVRCKVEDFKEADYEGLRIFLP
jgi:hypothetical protein